MLPAPIADDVAPSVGADHFDELFGDEVGSGQERVVTGAQVDRAGSPVGMEALQGEGGAAVLRADEIRRGSALPCRPGRRCPEGPYRLRGQAVPRPGSGLLVCQVLPEAVAERGGGVAGNADRAVGDRRDPDRVLLAAHDVGLRLPDVWQVRGNVDQMTSGRVVGALRDDRAAVGVPDDDGLVHVVERVAKRPGVFKQAGGPGWSALSAGRQLDRPARRAGLLMNSLGNPPPPPGAVADECAVHKQDLHHLRVSIQLISPQERVGRYLDLNPDLAYCPDLVCEG